MRNLIIFVKTLSFVSFIACGNVKICAESYYEGTCFVVDVPERKCVNLPNRKWGGSIDTKGQCVRLYEENDCHGESVFFRPGSPYHDNLCLIGIENQASSLKGCRLSPPSLSDKICEANYYDYYDDYNNNDLARCKDKRKIEKNNKTEDKIYYDLFPNTYYN